MELPKQVVKSTRNNPRLLTLFGQSKVGKTTILTKLPNCLIVDTEKGTDLIDALKVNVSNLKELADLYKSLIEERKENKFHYDFIALDTLDKIVEWLDTAICKNHGVTNLIDIPYGGGYNEVRIKTMQWIERFERVTPHVILSGHRKKTMETDENNTVSVASLELPGRLKNLVMAESDAVGYIYRHKEEDKPSELMVSFVADDELEAGARQDHLRGKKFKFDWNKIYTDKQN